METVLNFLSAIGIATLSVPVFSLDWRKGKLAEISKIVAKREAKGDRNTLDEIATEVRKERSEDVARWRKIDRVCLYFGYTLLLGSGIARIFA